MIKGMAEKTRQILEARDYLDLKKNHAQLTYQHCKGWTEEDTHK